LHRDDVVLDVAARSKPGVGAEPLETLLLQPLSESLAENLDQIAGPERVWTGLATAEIAAVAASESHGPHANAPARLRDFISVRTRPLMAPLCVKTQQGVGF
jgi:hypothetical protein